MDLLERMLLDESTEPTDLPISLLKTITNDFSDDMQIGNGGFAVVYKGFLASGRTVAVKKLKNTIDMDESKYIKEVGCLLRVRHNNIVRFLGYCADTERKMSDYKGKFVMADVRHRLLCFEYLRKGSLHDYITDASCGLEWKKRYQIIKGICEGLHYLHKKNIVHLDLKPANILLDDNMVPKISDFGLSRCFDDAQSRAIITSKLFGSTGYVAPEFHGGVVSFKWDIYSLGIIFTEILTGKKGYSSIDNVVESWKNRFETTSADTLLKQVRACAEISVDCANYDPEKRPVIQSIIQKLTTTEITDETNNESSMTPFLAQAPPIKPLDNQMSLDDLDAIKVIGKSSSEIVQLVRHKWTGQFFSVKVIQLNIQEDKRRQIAVELKIILSIQCQYIVVCYQCFYVNSAVSIVMEYMDGGSLSDFLKAVKTIPEFYLAAICKQILRGLVYLHHEKHIIHRDLKPSNILINHRGEVKISDFGESAIISSSSAQTDTFTGTFDYMAPERICGGKHDCMSDIWSLGLVMLECATGKIPYAARETFYEFLVAVIDQPSPSAPPDQFSEEFCSFISACIQKDVWDRSPAQILLGHPFLSMYDDLNVDLASYFATADLHSPPLSK